MSLKPRDIRAMSREERLKKLEELRLELMKLRTQALLGTLENPGKIRVIKKTIARILTINREEELKELKLRKKRQKK